MDTAISKNSKIRLLEICWQWWRHTQGPNGYWCNYEDNNTVSQQTKAATPWSNPWPTVEVEQTIVSCETSNNVNCGKNFPSQTKVIHWGKSKKRNSNNMKPSDTHCKKRGNQHQQYYVIPLSWATLSKNKNSMSVQGQVGQYTDCFYIVHSSILLSIKPSDTEDALDWKLWTNYYCTNKNWNPFTWVQYSLPTWVVHLILKNSTVPK